MFLTSLKLNSFGKHNCQKCAVLQVSNCTFMFASFFRSCFFGGVIFVHNAKRGKYIVFTKKLFIKNIHTCFIPPWTLENWFVVRLFFLNLSLSPLLSQDVLEKGGLCIELKRGTHRIFIVCPSSVCSPSSGCKHWKGTSYRRIACGHTLHYNVHVY